MFISMPRLSPDGERIAAMMIDGATASIWVYDWKRGTRIRISGGSNVYSTRIGPRTAGI